jgi:hypothetical protein
LVKPKPDISLATKTGHFNLLTTDLFLDPGHKGTEGTKLNNQLNGFLFVLFVPFCCYDPAFA